MYELCNKQCHSEVVPRYYYYGFFILLCSFELFIFLAKSFVLIKAPSHMLNLLFKMKHACGFCLCV